MTSIYDRPLAFVDLETTGGNATQDRITEIAIVTFDGVESQRWTHLLDPQMRIPSAIEHLTGISDAMVAGQPCFADLADEILARLDGHLFVAHNARFDYGFLKNEFRRIGIAFRMPMLCTVKLSRKLFPHYRHHNLDSLIERHGLCIDTRHRALGDADAIFQFWQVAQASVPAKQLHAALKELSARPSLPPNLNADAVDRLPDGCGVYLLYGDNELPLYVGKSKRLRQRVLAHFAGDHAQAKEMSLSQQVRRIEWIECAGEIEALLTEARLIKEKQPTLNRQLRRNRECCAWRLSDRGLDLWQPELLFARDLRPGHAQTLYGLFKSRRDAHEALLGIAAEHALCLVVLGMEKGRLGKPCFARQLQRCAGACVGAQTLAQHSLRLREALQRLRLQHWPFAGPAILVEGELRHVIDGWCYFGTARSDTEAVALAECGQPEFDRDTYHILVKHLERLVPLAPDERSREAA